MTDRVGKIALVTGAASVICFATVERGPSDAGIDARGYRPQ
jgi:NADP-dependent 3-hydroxy acid dehydrogenase YdfG